MGTQQLLLILLGILIVGLAIAVGFSMSARQAVLSNRDAMAAEMIDLAANAHQYRSRLPSSAGGGGSYMGYQIPASLQSSENGSYALVSVSPDQVSFIGTSAQGFGTMSGAFGRDGRLAGSYAFTGRFQ